MTGFSAAWMICASSVISSTLALISGLLRAAEKSSASGGSRYLGKQVGVTEDWAGDRHHGDGVALGNGAGIFERTPQSRRHCVGRLVDALCNGNDLVQRFRRDSPEFGLNRRQYAPVVWVCR
jgi:hypothetical protein